MNQVPCCHGCGTMVDNPHKKPKRRCADCRRKYMQRKALEHKARKYGVNNS